MTAAAFGKDVVAGLVYGMAGTGRQKVFDKRFPMLTRAFGPDTAFLPSRCVAGRGGFFTRG